MKSIAFILLCMILAACMPPTASEPTAEPTQLVGTRWSLRSLNGHELRPDTVITLAFEPERLWGRAGCNVYGRPYTHQPDGEFIQGGVGATEVSCLWPEGALEQEREYISSLGKVNRYQVEGDSLLLTNEQEGISLEYQRLPRFDVDPAELMGKTWQLVSATGLEDVDPAAFTLQFDGNSFHGTTICRDYTGMYQASGDSFASLSMSMTTEVTCPEEELIAEHVYTGLLSIVWQYNVSETQLELYTDSGKRLLFKAAAQN